MDYKRIFILGAGSSIGHSEGLFPSINDFLRKAELKFGSDSEFKNVLDYAQKVTGKSLTRGSINIEDFFTQIEIEIERSPSPKLLAIRSELLRLIQDILLKLGQKIVGRSGEYEDFYSIIKPSDTIITFNWDLLLDNVLNREDILKERYETNQNKATGPYWNFILNLSAIGEMTYKHASIDLPYQEWQPEIGYYLKVHGSIDWFYCSNEHCRASSKVFPVLEPKQTHFCSDCHEPLEFLIIPPVLNKGYRQYPLIRRIWNVAAKELSVADEIIIWGYSLPLTDFYALWLLRQARQSEIKKLVLINPSVLGRKRGISKSFVNRFYDIYHDKLPKESICLYESFRDYHNKSGIQYEDNLYKPV